MLRFVTPFPPCLQPFTLPADCIPLRVSASAFAVKYFSLTKLPFPALPLVHPATLSPPSRRSPSANLPPCFAALGRRSRVRTRFIGQSAQFSNLSTRNVAQSFALKFRADVPETHQWRKTFASKEREKTAFFPCGGIWGAAKNHGVCWLCRQAAGQTAKRRRHTFHHDERKRVMQAQAVTADVTPAHMVKCGGNADQRRRVKWEA